MLVYGPVIDGIVTRTFLMRRMYSPGVSSASSHSGMLISQVPVALSASSDAGLSCRSEMCRVSSYSRLFLDDRPQSIQRADRGFRAGARPPNAARSLRALVCFVFSRGSCG